MSEQISKIQRELGLLKGYAFLATALFGILWFGGFTTSPEKQRVDSPGTLGLTFYDDKGRATYKLPDSLTISPKK